MKKSIQSKVMYRTHRKTRVNKTTGFCWGSTGMTYREYFLMILPYSWIEEKDLAKPKPVAKEINPEEGATIVAFYATNSARLFRAGMCD